MWNKKQRRFQKNIALHVIQALPYDSVFRSADGTQIYCHPSKETESRCVLRAYFTELEFTSITYPSMLKRIIDKYPRAV